MKNKALIIVILSISWSVVSAQMKDYRYIRPLTGTLDTWNKIIIPEEVFAKLQADLSDIRIFGITTGSDTIEAPYLLNVDAGKSEYIDIAFEMINQVRNRDGYFYTLKLKPESTINQVEMDFGQDNFDWKIRLEGSQDMNEWFTITEDYRILSIKNEHTDYHYTTVIFPSARFPYFRIRIPAGKDPELKGVRVKEHRILQGSFMTGVINNLKVEEDKESKQTVIRIDLQTVIPVSYLKLKVKDGFEFYRPVTINSITDSVETPKGWRYNYRLLGSGTLSSIENPEFRFPGVLTGKLYITIENHDNSPLQIDSVIVKGNVHELITRITGPAEYFMAYGNVKASRPYYDIGNFRDRIPEKLTLVNLGEEQEMGEHRITRSYSIFENKAFLWAVMVIIIIVLGWFSVRMIGKKA